MRLTRALSAAALALLAVGCDNVLTTTPGSNIPADQIIVDSKSAQGALTGAYDGLQSLSYYGLDIQLLGDLPADNSTWVGTYQFLGDIENNQIAADNPEITDMTHPGPVHLNCCSAGTCFDESITLSARSIISVR